MGDERTIAEVWEKDGSVTGYVWITFTEMKEHGLAVAYVRDIAVTSSHQRRGVAQEMLHTKRGFRAYYVQYEKLFVDEITWS